MLRLCLITLMLTARTLQASELPPPAYQFAAREANIPSIVLYAVALQESGMTLQGRMRPWPWTLNVGGTAERYPNRASACTGLLRALRRVPATRIDVGLGQINIGYHGEGIQRPCDLLDPYRNLTLAATLLREHHTPGEDWLLAVGRYHRPAGGEPALRYRHSVKQHLNRIQPDASTLAFHQE